MHDGLTSMRGIKSGDSAFLLVRKRRGSEFPIKAVDGQPGGQFGVEVS